MRNYSRRLLGYLSIDLSRTTFPSWIHSTAPMEYDSQPTAEYKGYSDKPKHTKGERLSLRELMSEHNANLKVKLYPY